MNIEALFASDLASEYLRTYREWRYVYGLHDPCIEELKAAILADSDRGALAIDQKDRLEILLRLIEHEQASHLELVE